MEQTQSKQYLVGERAGHIFLLALGVLLLQIQDFWKKKIIARNYNQFRSLATDFFYRTEQIQRAHCKSKTKPQCEGKNKTKKLHFFLTEQFQDGAEGDTQILPKATHREGFACMAIAKRRNVKGKRKQWLALLQVNLKRGWTMSHNGVLIEEIKLRPSNVGNSTNKCQQLHTYPQWRHHRPSHKHSCPPWQSPPMAPHLVVQKRRR